MPKKLEKSPVTFWSWFLTIFMIALPCVGFIYVVIGAFLSPNESRRNFYRAHLAWILVVILLYVALLGAGMAPSVLKIVKEYQQEHSLGVRPPKSESSAGHKTKHSADDSD